ncbi:MAG: protein translocase SEC61 complex subunit gamma [Candidatus Micrarchaeota archaeon]|nr:protein translocase SEC61 complex subunit gamma [Candidatus Micrarchaeota archaeon]
MDIGARLRTFMANSKHILSVSYKPSYDELKVSIKIVLLGILILGVIGVVMAIITSLILSGSPNFT